MKIGHSTVMTGPRLWTLSALATLIFCVIILRLFQLQVLGYTSYTEIAKGQHYGAITLPAKRGEILARDKHSGELSKLATNTTLDLLYVDPLVTEDKVGVAKSLTPLIFTENDYNDCLKAPKECPYTVYDEQTEMKEPLWKIDENVTTILEPTFKTYPQMVDEVSADILRKISKSEVDFVVLRRDTDPDLMAEVVNKNLPGIFVDTKRFMVYGDPTLIPDGHLKEISTHLAALLEEPASDIEKNLTRKKVRYVYLKNQLEPSISRKIREMNFKGVVLVPEHWRFYPEGPLAAHLIGFLNREGVGQYGIEGYYNTELEGKKGTIYAESDPFGREITVSDSKIINAVDGDNIVLTIDRVVQKKVEEVLAKAVPQYRADSGQVIIMDPFTGAIIAMANFPTFNPNRYGDSFKLRKLKQDEVEDLSKTIPVFKKNDKGKFISILPEDLENKDVEKFIYENGFGPGVFKNKAVSEFYEPGSVFKSLIMAAALDAKEVSPETTYMNDGPLHIDEFEIKNSTGYYGGKTTMVEVLEKSLNTGMAFVAKKLGKQLMYQYMKNYGFGEYTNIQLEGETKGKLDFYKKWSKAQLLTQSFGQGIIVTPLQIITAWAALANGGKLMEPYIVDSIIREGKEIKTEPKVLQRVISEEAASIITSMSVNVVQHGRANIPGFLVAGKTGTSQIAGPSGKYETGDGTTITSFAGYLPALQPKFVMLVKFDRPRIGFDSTWGETTAAPVFKEIAEFLIHYYDLQPSH